MSKHPHIKFQYDAKRDLENVKLGLKLQRQGRNPNVELLAIVKKYGDNPSDEELATYLDTRWQEKIFMRDIVLDACAKAWSAMEVQYFSTITREMNIDWSDNKEIGAYITIEHGCGYDGQNHSWFMVSSHWGIPKNMLTVMHETIHLATMMRWEDYCLKEKGLTEVQYWDVKESLTVLINAWFADIIFEYDLGYPEHKPLRRQILDWFKEGKKFPEILEGACDYAKDHPEIHPSWA